MEATFKATPEKGRFKHHDLERYLIENEGVELDIKMQPAANVSEKLRMYNYLFGPIADCAMRGYTSAGWEGVDKVKAMYMLRSELSKDFITNSKTGEKIIDLLDLKKVSKERLLKVVQDSLHFLEVELHQQVPDAAEWKNYKSSGRNMERVK